MTTGNDRNLLDLTLAAARKDIETTSLGGAPLAPKFLDGMSFRPSTAIHDERGHLIEVFDTRWDWSKDVYSQGYLSIVAPGVVKGWALHKTHDDRYFVVSGKLLVVTFDPRPESSTYGQLCKTILTADQPGIFNIPKFVWHADWNIGTGNAVLMNLPTAPYNHENPDKFRLPLDTDLIPFRFEGATGW